MKVITKQTKQKLKKHLEHDKNIFGNMPDKTPVKISEPAELLANLLWLIWSGQPSAVVSTQKEMRQQAQLYLSTYFRNIPDSLLADAIQHIPDLASHSLDTLRSTFIGIAIKEAVRAELGMDWQTAIKRAKRKLDAGEDISDLHPAIAERVKNAQ